MHITALQSYSIQYHHHPWDPFFLWANQCSYFILYPGAPVSTLYVRMSVLYPVQYITDVCRCLTSLDVPNHKLWWHILWYILPWRHPDIKYTLVNIVGTMPYLAIEDQLNNNRMIHRSIHKSKPQQEYNTIIPQQLLVHNILSRDRYCT